MTYSQTAEKQSILPSINGHTLWTIVLAGALSTVAFEYFGQSLSPMLGFSSLAPVPLANAVISVVFGQGYRPGAELLHYLAGVIGYPIGWMFIFRPLSLRLAPSLPTFFMAVLYGVVLWVFALYVMAALIAGNPPFLGFTNITWVALVGHVLFALVTAGVVGWRERE